MKPFGGMEQLAWNTTSDKIALHQSQEDGQRICRFTNSDIYVYDL